MNSPKLIVVEGPDCCGKSTLARALATTLNAVFWHFTSTRALAPANYDYMVNGLENARENLKLGRNVVFDRFWPSEHCYGPVFRPTMELRATELKELCLDLDPVYIYCKDADGLERAVKRHARNKDESHPYQDQDYGRVYLNYLEHYTNMVYEERHQLSAYFFDEDRLNRGEDGVDTQQLESLLELYALS